MSRLIDNLGCPKYGFFGYSFGGLDAPDAEPPPATYGQSLDDGGMAAVVGLIEGEEGITLPVWANAEFMETDPEQFRLTIAANARDPDPWKTFSRIRAATVLIAGSDEDADALQDSMAAMMPDAESVHLPGVGHGSAFLRPDEVTSLAIPVLRGAAGA